MLRVKLILLLSKITSWSRLTFYASSTPVNHCLNQSEQNRVEECEQGGWHHTHWHLGNSLRLEEQGEHHTALSTMALPAEPSARALPAWASPHPDSLSSVDILYFWPWTGGSGCLNVDFPLYYCSFLWIMDCLGKNQEREGEFLSKIKNVCLNDFILHADEVLQGVLRQ